LLFLFFTGRLRFGRKEEDLPPPPDDKAFDRAGAEREIDEALGEVPPPPEDLEEAPPAEGATETPEGVSAEEYEEVEVVEEPIEEEIVFRKKFPRVKKSTRRSLRKRLSSRRNLHPRSWSPRRRSR
jgi:hypothetical protein